MNSRLICNTILLVCFCGSTQAGVLEICKDSDPAGGLSGIYGFTILGQSGTILVPVGACTDSFVLPEGLAVISEVPSSDAVFETVWTFPDDRLISFDPQTGSVTVLIVPGDLSDPSNETVVDFINAPAAIPEPGTGWAIVAGLAVLALRRKLAKQPAPVQPQV